MDATEGNPMDPEQPDALYLLEGGEEATEGGDRKRNGRGKKRNWNTYPPSACLIDVFCLVSTATKPHSPKLEARHTVALSGTGHLAITRH